MKAFIGVLNKKDEAITYLISIVVDYIYHCVSEGNFIDLRSLSTVWWFNELIVAVFYLSDLAKQLKASFWPRHMPAPNR